jgi:hypothetical protein
MLCETNLFLYPVSVKNIYDSLRMGNAKLFLLGAGFRDNLIYEEIMPDRAKRKVIFLRMTDAEGKEVFRKWDELKNKIHYLLNGPREKIIKRVFYP